MAFVDQCGEGLGSILVPRKFLFQREVRGCTPEMGWTV